MNKTLKSCLPFITALCVSILSISTFTKGVENATSDATDFPQAFRTKIVVTHTVDGGPGSLRQAIIDAEANPGSDTITFNIPKSDPRYNSATNYWTITPLNPFPEISSGQTIIDATTQPGFNARPVIEINASLVFTRDLFQITSANNVIRGLVINRFNGKPDQHAVICILGDAATNNYIEGCFFGTDVTGTNVLKNATISILIFAGASRNTVGGSTEAQRNIISGCNDQIRGSVQIQCASANTIVGNYIGLDATGTVALGNAGIGIFIATGAKNNLILGNMISGSGYTGIEIYSALINQYTNKAWNDWSDRFNETSTTSKKTIAATGGRPLSSIGDESASSGNRILGNLIGTNENRPFDGSLGNKNAGIIITGNSPYNTIGGTGSGEGNIIAHNAREGILVWDSTAIGNTIRGNSITRNAGRGINTIYRGNLELEPPFMQKLAGGSNGSISGTTVADGIVDLYSDTGDEGGTYLGSAMATQGRFVFRGNIPLRDYITATLTDVSGNTSEFAELDPILPFVEILSPQFASVVPVRGFPIAMTFHDWPLDPNYYQSGIDSSSLRVTNNRKIGTIGKFLEAGADLSKFFSITNDRVVLIVPNELEFPIGENEIRVSIRDNVGNTFSIVTRFTATYMGLNQEANTLYVNVSPFKLKGFAIQAYVGTVEVNDVPVEVNNDQFEVNLPLNIGSNIVKLSAFDHAMNLIETRQYNLVYDDAPPSLSINSPTEGSTIQYTPVNVSGVVSEGNQVRVSISSATKWIQQADALGRFSGLVEVDEGESYVNVSAMDKSGNKTDAAIRVLGLAPPSSPGGLKLFLKSYLLSKFPFHPSTNDGISFQYVWAWQTVLTGDIRGNEYHISPVVGPSPINSEVHLEGELLIRQSGKELVLVRTPVVVLNYYAKLDYTLLGVDPQTTRGDILIFRLRQIGGSSRYVGIWYQVNGEASTITIPAIDEVGVAVKDKMTGLPSEYNLSQNYPNPFNPETKMNYQLPKTSEVKLEIFNLIGQCVITLVDEKQPAGYYTVSWNGRNRHGQPVASGVYFYRIKAEAFVMVKKLMVLR